MAAARDVERLFSSDYTGWVLVPFGVASVDAPWFIVATTNIQGHYPGGTTGMPKGAANRRRRL